MLPVSRFPEGAIATTLGEVGIALTSVDERTPDSVAPVSSESDRQIRSAEEFRLIPRIHYTKRTQIRELCTRHIPVLLKGVGTNLSGCWTPAGFIANYGDHEITIMDSRHPTPITVPARVFLEDLQKGENERGAVVKTKDFPPNNDLSSVAPTHFNGFMNVLPSVSSMRHDDFLNLAAHWPQPPPSPHKSYKPDLGPKMYMASGDISANGVIHIHGSTCLHKDMTDAVNLNTFSERGALWHIFVPSDSDKIRLYLKQHPAYKSEYGDPIHAQKIYLTSSDLAKLAEQQVIPFEIHQAQGDMVVIPAGCAHQVSNVSSSIKIAVDYVSVEGVPESEIMTKELQQERIEDVLQLRAMIWHTWHSLANYIHLANISTDSDHGVEKVAKSWKRAAHRAKGVSKDDKAIQNSRKRMRKLQISPADYKQLHPFRCPHPDCEDRRRIYDFWGVHSHLRSSHDIVIQRKEWEQFREHPVGRWQEMIVYRSRTNTHMSATPS